MTESVHWQWDSCGVFKKYRSHGEQVDILVFDGLTRFCFWNRPLKDELVGNLPGASIMTAAISDVFTGPPAKVAYIGHQALLQLQKKRSSHQGRQKPIILVGLSLGGLILKHALFLAAADPGLQSIMQCIQALLFVGTPHREDEDQEYGRILASVARYTRTEEREDCLGHWLYDNSEDFRELTTAWHLLPDFPVYSFSETKPIDGLDRVLVTKHSATLGAENEVHLSISATHSGLLNALFENTNPADTSILIHEKSAYQTIYEVLRTLTRSEQLQKSCSMIRAKTDQFQPLLPRLLEYSCPVCASLPDGELPVGLDAPHLEYIVDSSASTARRLRVWNRDCGLALATLLILRHWWPHHDITCPECKGGVHLSGLKSTCIQPTSNRGPRFKVKTEHDVPSSDCSAWVVHVDPLSEATKRQMRSWIDKCDQHHNCRCPTSPASNRPPSTSEGKDKPDRATRLNDLLPTRLLDVRDLGRITLCEGASLQEVEANTRYATLSHCWGESRSFLTTNQNLQRMKQGFKLSKEVPKTFQDAIIVTHELGVPYLWIDSLCIIQDDISDWDREASQMARVYTNAYINIAALDSDDDTKGFLRTRPFPYTTVRLNSSTGESANIYLIQDCDESRPLLRRVHVLRTRGWVLQEQYLSTRILWFTSKKIGWSCKKVKKTEDGKSFGFKVPDLRSTKWREVFTDFSGRSLTYDTDKLPALAGVASAFSALSALSGENQGRYCAGLWQKTLPENLLFYWNNPTCPTQYLAPSWSWASLNGQVEWLDTFFAGYDLLNGVAVVDCDMKLASDNQYGQVMEGSSITISGPLIKLRPRVSTNQEETFHKKPYEILEGVCKGQTLWCRLDLPHAQPAEVLGMPLATGQDSASAYRGLVDLSVVGIALAVAEGSKGGYKRVGVFGKDWITQDKINDLESYPLRVVVLY